MRGLFCRQHFQGKQDSSFSKQFRRTFITIGNIILNEKHNRYSKISVPEMHPHEHSSSPLYNSASLIRGTTRERICYNWQIHKFRVFRRGVDKHPNMTGNNSNSPHFCEISRGRKRGRKHDTKIQVSS